MVLPFSGYELNEMQEVEKIWVRKSSVEAREIGCFCHYIWESDFFRSGWWNFYKFHQPFGKNILGFISAWWNNISGATIGKNRDWNVCLMFRGLERMYGNMD